VNQSTLATTRARLQLQQWRIIPTDAACEVTPPSVPSALTAQSQPASISLSWEACSDDDLAGYMILRADSATGEWNTIARKVADNHYTDHGCQQGRTYLYAVKSIDRSDNMSILSDTIVGRTSGARCMIGQWQFEQTLTDGTINQFDARIGGTERYTSLAPLVKYGKGCLNLDGGSYVQLPYQVANTAQLTISMWVRWTGTSLGDGQRLFDFGVSPSCCMYLTPSEGGRMKLVLRKGATQQVLEAPRLGSGTWKHVAVTFGTDSVSLYVSGKLQASSSVIDLRPSDVCPVMNYLGRGQTAEEPLWKGYMDDVRIFNYALPANAVASLSASQTADVNTDGVVDTQDVLRIYELIQHSSRPGSLYLPEDVNADGIVDTQDVLAVYDKMKE